MERIQRKRERGWRMPEGAVYVGRPSKWGNPFPIAGGWIMWTAVAMGLRADAAGRREAAVRLYRAWMTGDPVSVEPRQPSTVIRSSDGTERTVDQARDNAARIANIIGGPKVPLVPSIEPLRDATALVCWCREDEPCHASVLIELLEAA